MEEKAVSILVLTIWYYPIGGIESFLLRILEKYPKNVRVTLGIFCIGKHDQVIFQNPRIDVHFLTKRHMLGEIFNLAKENRCTIIHSHSISLVGVVGVITARRLKIPIILTNHRAPVYQTRALYDQISLPITRWLFRIVNNSAQVVTVPSETVRSIFLKIGVKTPVKVISGGVDTRIFTPPTDKKDSGKRNLLYVGRFAYDKHLNILLRAFAEVSRDHEVLLTMVGAPSTFNSDMPRLEGLIAELNLEKKVVLPGFFEPQSQELLDAYHTADIFCLTSLFETQSLVLLEAMASGLPSVVSNAGALPELIDDGKNGLLFKAGDWKDMAKNLNQLIDDKELSAKMSACARATAEMHDDVHTVEEFVGLYQALV